MARVLFFLGMLLASCLYAGTDPVASDNTAFDSTHPHGIGDVDTDSPDDEGLGLADVLDVGIFPARPILQIESVTAIPDDFSSSQQIRAPPVIDSLS